MKLIREIVEEVKFFKESSESGKGKSYFIEGIFMQADMVNRNGRRYPGQVMENEVRRYVTESVDKNRAYGELGHPNGPTINLDRVSHMIKDLRMEGSNVIGKAKIMDTPMGNIVKNLMDEGASLGVSSRAMGTLKEKGGIMEVQGDFHLATAADIVADPSAPEAYVNGIMEGAEWVFVEGRGWVEQFVDESRRDIRRTSSNNLAEKKIEIFEKFLNRLSRGQ
jgi:hypothetical protein